jgi:hypothetical protein
MMRRALLFALDLALLIGVTLAVGLVLAPMYIRWAVQQP